MFACSSSQTCKKAPHHSSDCVVLQYSIRSIVMRTRRLLTITNDLILLLQLDVGVSRLMLHWMRSWARWQICRGTLWETCAWLGTNNLLINYTDPWKPLPHQQLSKVKQLWGPVCGGGKKSCCWWRGASTELDASSKVDRVDLWLGQRSCFCYAQIQFQHVHHGSSAPRKSVQLPSCTCLTRMQQQQHPNSTVDFRPDSCEEECSSMQFSSTWISYSHQLCGSPWSVGCLDLIIY